VSDAATVTYVQEPLTRATLPTVAGFTGVSKTAWPGRVAACVEVSGCNLRTEMGRMLGSYEMENLHSKRIFEVNIPSFEMIVPFKGN
jgi:ApaG protein